MCSHMWNKTEIKLKQICFISTEYRRYSAHCLIPVLFQRLSHVKQNAETIIVVMAWNNWNKSKTFHSCFSVLFQFHFRCASGLIENFVATKAYITIAIRLRYDYGTTIPRRIRLRRKWSKLRFVFDSTAIGLRHNYDEKLTCSFLLASNRVEWKQAGARRRIDGSYSHIAVESSANRNFDHFRRSRMRPDIVVS